jgi:drug/metabolite transporter (DMT)-like permease
MLSDQKKAYLLAGFAILFWSTSSAAFKLTLRYLNTTELLFYSTLTATLALFLFLIGQKKLHLILAYTKKGYLHSIILGFLNPFFYYTILFKAYSLLPGQIAQPLNFIWPLMIVLLSIPLLKQKIKFRSILAILVSFFGVIVISTKGNFTSLNLENPWGIFLAMFSSIIWALFFIMNVRDTRDEVCKLFFSFGFGFLFASLVFIFNFQKPNIIGLLGAIYIGLFEMAITFVIWVKALKLSKTTAQVNNFIYITPFLALIFLSILTKEKILTSSIIGIIFIILGIVIQRRFGSKT